MTSVLLLDSAGAPADWASPQDVACYASRGLIAWELGEVFTTLRGGTNARSGELSVMDIRPIVAVKGKAFAVKRSRVPSFSAVLLKRRDRHLCAYCGGLFREDQLTVEHIEPESRGGPTSWMNCVAACKSCNNRKDNRTPEEAGMPLLYVPYEPNRFEAFILQNRRILADQMAWLMDGVGANSRLRTSQ